MSNTDDRQYGPATDDQFQQLSQELYSSLRRMARVQRRRMNFGETLQTTALVNEAWLKLARHGGWTSREHFLNTSATVMRHVLVDYARAQIAAKRGGGRETVPIDEVEALVGESSENVIHIDLALTRMQSLEPLLARVVECRFFAGYTEQETADLTGVSPRTIQRQWLKARAWLYQELGLAT